MSGLLWFLQSFPFRLHHMSDKYTTCLQKSVFSISQKRESLSLNISEDFKNLQKLEYHPGQQHKTCAVHSVLTWSSQRFLLPFGPAEMLSYTNVKDKLLYAFRFYSKNIWSNNKVTVTVPEMFVYNLEPSNDWAVNPKTSISRWKRIYNITYLKHFYFEMMLTSSLMIHPNIISEKTICANNFIEVLSTDILKSNLICSNE